MRVAGAAVRLFYDDDHITDKRHNLLSNFRDRGSLLLQALSKVGNLILPSKYIFSLCLREDTEVTGNINDPAGEGNAKCNNMIRACTIVADCCYYSIIGEGFVSLELPVD